MRKLFAAAAAVALALGLVVAGPAGVASASAGQCTGGTNGFRDIPDSWTGTYATGFVVNGDTNPVYFTLYYSTIDGKQMGWAHLAGKTSPAGSDRFWMDWKGGPTTPWLQCGPFPNRADGKSATTPAKTTAASYQFRVCGSVYPDATVRCSSWW